MVIMNRYLLAFVGSCGLFVCNGFTQNSKILTRADIDYGIFYSLEGVEASAEKNFSDGYKNFLLSLENDPYSLETRYFLNICQNNDDLSAVSTFFAAIQAEKKGHPGLADSLVAQLSDSPLKPVIYGYLAYKKGNADQALQLLDRGFADADTIKYVVYLKSMILLDLENSQESIALLSQLLESDPYNYQLHYLRGLAYRKLNRYGQAIRDFELALRIAPPIGRQLEEGLIICQTYNQRGLALMQRKKYVEAIRNFDSAIGMQPEFSEPYLNRGIAYRNMNQFPAAISDFNRAIELNEKYVEAFFNRGRTFMDMNQWDQASRDLRTVVLFNPGHAKSFFYLAEMAFDREDYYQAISWYDSSLHYAQDHYWAYYKRAQAYDHLKKFPGAVRDYDLFFTMAPDSFYTHKVSAWERSRLLKKWLDEQKIRHQE